MLICNLTVGLFFVTVVIGSVISQTTDVSEETSFECPTSETLCVCSEFAFEVRTMRCQQLGIRSSTPAFDNRTSLTTFNSITIGDDNGATSIDTVGPRAFAGLNVIFLRMRLVSLRSIDAAAFAGIGSVLEFIDLSDNRIETLPDSSIFDGLVSLGQLTLAGNRISSLRASWFTGTYGNNLQLDLSRNRIKSIDGGQFANLLRLVKLDLSSNELTTVSADAFNGLSSLQGVSLNLSNNFIDTIESGAFAQLKYVSELDLSNNRLVFLPPDMFTDIDYRLSYLLLSNNNLSSSSLQLDDHSTGILSPLTALKTLDLSMNIIDVIPEEAFKRMKLLERLILSSNLKLTSLTAAQLQDLENLRELDISQTRVTSMPCDVLANLSSLASVNLAGNEITDIAMLLTGGNGNVYCWPDSISSIDLSYNKIEVWPTVEKLNISRMHDQILKLGGNPFICDCDLTVQRQSMWKLVSDFDSFTCASPAQVSGRPVLCYDNRLLRCNTGLSVTLCDYYNAVSGICNLLDYTEFNSSYDSPLCSEDFSRCTISDNGHYMTFDMQTLDYSGTCKYNLASSLNFSDSESFKIYAKNYRSANGQLYPSYIEIVLTANTVRLIRGNRLTTNSIQVDVTLNGRSVQVPYIGTEFRIEYIGSAVRITTSFDVSIEIDHRSVIIVSVPSTYASKVFGLCGNYDDNAANDFIMANGTDASRWPNAGNIVGDSYVVDDRERSSSEACSAITALPVSCDLNKYSSTCSTINDSQGIFADCVSFLRQDVADALAHKCINDACLYSKETVCDIIQTFTDICSAFGVGPGCIDWYSAVGCNDFSSCPDDMIYERAASPCQATCTDVNSELNCSYARRNACKCPNGQRLYKGSCRSNCSTGCIDDHLQLLEVGANWAGPNCTLVSCNVCDNCKNGHEFASTPLQCDQCDKDTCILSSTSTTRQSTVAATTISLVMITSPKPLQSASPEDIRNTTSSSYATSKELHLSSLATSLAATQNAVISTESFRTTVGDIPRNVSILQMLFNNTSNSVSVTSSAVLRPSVESTTKAAAESPQNVTSNEQLSSPSEVSKVSVTMDHQTSSGHQSMTTSDQSQLSTLFEASKASVTIDHEASSVHQSITTSGMKSSLKNQFFSIADCIGLLVFLFNLYLY